MNEGSANLKAEGRSVRSMRSGRLLARALLASAAFGIGLVSHGHPSTAEGLISFALPQRSANTPQLVWSFLEQIDWCHTMGLATNPLLSGRVSWSQSETLMDGTTILSARADEAANGVPIEWTGIFLSLSRGGGFQAVCSFHVPLMPTDEDSKSELDALYTYLKQLPSSGTKLKQFSNGPFRLESCGLIKDPTGRDAMATLLIETAVDGSALHVHHVFSMNRASGCD